MAWYNIVPRATCLVSFDWNSKVDGNKVCYSHDESKFAIAAKPLIKSEMYYPSPKGPVMAKVINTADKMKLNTPVQNVMDMTLVLIAAAPGASSEYVASFVSGTQEFFLLHNWGGIVTTSHTTYLRNSYIHRKSVQADNSLHYLGYTYNSLTRKKEIYSDIGIDDYLNDPGVIVNNFNFSSTGTWHNSVVALGLFDIALSEEEVMQIVDTAFEELTESVEEPKGRLESISPTPVEINYSGVKDRKEVATVQPLKPLKLPKTSTKPLAKSLNYTLEDIVTKEDIPIIVKLFLYERHDGVLLKTTFSNADGKFFFHNLDPTKDYMVHTYDPAVQYRSIVKDYLRIL